MHCPINEKTNLFKTKCGSSSNAGKTQFSQRFLEGDLCDLVCQNKHKKIHVN